MRKMSDEELAVEAYHMIVQFWEDIPRRVDDFCAKHGEHFRPLVEKTLRGNGGGEEIYESSKEFLASRKPLTRVVDIPGPSVMLICTHGIHRGDYCSECKGTIGEES